MEPRAFIGVDLGGTLLKAVAATDDGVVLTRRAVPSRAWAGRADLLTQIATVIDGLRAEVTAGDATRHLAGVGLAVPGVVDAPAGRVEFTVALSPD